MTNAPLVTIIVITYLEKSKKYLDLCMRSIENLNFDEDKLEVLIISHASYQPQYPNAKTIYPHLDQFYPAEGINYAMRCAHHDSKYFLILNDDVILTKNSLQRLVGMVGDNDVIANAISPCDNHFNYQLIFGFYKDDIFHQMKESAYLYEELIPFANELMNSDSPYPGGVVKQPYLCIYATLIPRKCHERIGDWDEKFKTGQDDLDYSLRAHKQNIQTVSVLDALIWHFGGVTVESTLNHYLRQENVRYFKQKWGFMPPGIPESFLGEK